MGEETSITIELITQAHPKNLKPIAAERAVCQQLERLMRRMTEAEALTYLMERTKLYAACVAQWPSEKFEFVPESQNWFNAGSYAADEKLWRKYATSQAAKEPGVFDWRKDMIEHPENYVQGNKNGRH